MSARDGGIRPCKIGDVLELKRIAKLRDKSVNYCTIPCVPCCHSMPFTSISFDIIVKIIMSLSSIFYGSNRRTMLPPFPLSSGILSLSYAPLIH